MCTIALFIYILILFKKWKKNDMADDVAQLGHSNNKCYVLTFRYEICYMYNIFTINYK